MTLLNISVTPIWVTSFVYLLTDLLYAPDFWKKRILKKQLISLGPHSATQRYYMLFLQPVFHLAAVNQLFLWHFGHFSAIFTPILVSVSGSHRNVFVLVCHGSLYFRWPWTRHQDNSELSANGCEEEAELNKLGDPSPPVAPPLESASGVIIRANQGILRVADY